MRQFLLALALLIPVSASAVEPDEILSDPTLELRAREVSKQLRCVVCQNQDIDSSNAGVARDLRLLLRGRLVTGDTNDEAIAFIQARYGDFVLLKPPFKPETYALWFAPPILVLLAMGIGGIVLLRSRGKERKSDLSDAEEAEVERILMSSNEENRT